MIKELTLETEDHGRPAMEVLARHIPAASQAYLRQLFKRGKIRRQGQVVSEETVLSTGDRLALPQSARLEELLHKAPAPTLEILFEDDHLLVVNKPAGLATHAAKGHEQDNLVSYAQAMVKARGDKYRIAPAHRLDLGTSGPVLLAKGRRAAGACGRLLSEGQTAKFYLALVAGQPPSAGTLVTPVPAKGKNREAATSFRVLGAGSGFSLVELELHSGRTHQIRRQLADHGFPLAGDRRYRGPELPGLERLFLHCCRLELPNPFSTEPLKITSCLPGELEKVLFALKIPAPHHGAEPGKE